MDRILKWTARILGIDALLILLELALTELFGRQTGSLILAAALVGLSLILRLSRGRNRN